LPIADFIFLARNQFGVRRLDAALDRPRSGRLNLAPRFSAGIAIENRFRASLSGHKNYRTASDSERDKHAPLSKEFVKN
jgi:hypothetical protein